MPTTENLVVALTPGSDIGDPSNPAAAVLKEVGDQLSKTDGVQDINFGMQIESPDTFQLMVSKYCDSWAVCVVLLANKTASLGQNRFS
jgi:hypothetical protein